MKKCVFVLLLSSTLAAQAPTLHLPPLDRELPPAAESIYQALAPRVDAEVAMATVRLMAPLWRLAGNPAFEQSQQYIHDQLTAAGLSPRYESFTDGSTGWEQRTGTVRLGGPTGEVLLSREAARVPLAINSFSTPAGGASYRVVDAGAGTNAAAYEGKDVKGAVVLVSGPIGSAWQPGRSKAGERILLVAHVQEPGANDNASGCGTLLAAALAVHDAVRRGAAPAPERTITFLWVDEIRGSQQWIKDHPDEARRVLAMLSLDMTGEDTAKTGGTFLIEKGPDPSAIWERPSDPHSDLR